MRPLSQEELAALRAEIRALPPGRPCPSIRQLKSRFHCSQRTAEATLKLLEEEKLLSRLPDGRCRAGAAAGASPMTAVGIALDASQPKYQAVAADLRHRIGNREYAPGAPLPSEAEFCQCYGVSRVTVRGALDQLAREGLIERARGQGTFVRPAAASVHTLKIVFRPLRAGLANDAFLTELLDEAQRQTEARGLTMQMVAVNGGDDFAKLAARDASLVGDGTAVVFVSYDVGPADLALLTARRVPASVIGPQKSAGGLPFVNGDHESGGEIAVRYLWRMGHRAIAFACGPTGYDMADRLLVGYRRGLEKCGLPFLPELLVAPTAWDRDEGAAAAAELLARPVRPDALIVYGDWAMYGAVDVLRRRGLEAPRDLALLHVGSCRWLDKALSLRLTHVLESHQAMIAQALRLVDRAAAGDRAPYGVFNPYSLVVGDSCGIGGSAPVTKE